MDRGEVAIVAHPVAALRPIVAMDLVGDVMAVRHRVVAWIAHHRDVMSVARQCVVIHVILVVVARPHVAHHGIAPHHDVAWIARHRAMVVRGVAGVAHHPVAARLHAMPGAVAHHQAAACRPIVAVRRRWLVVARHHAVVHPNAAVMMAHGVVVAVVLHLVAHARPMMALAVAHVAIRAIVVVRHRLVSRKRRPTTMAGRLLSTDVARCCAV
jgi:hypothetical protein